MGMPKKIPGYILDTSCVSDMLHLSHVLRCRVVLYFRGCQCSSERSSNGRHARTNGQLLNQAKSCTIRAGVFMPAWDDLVVLAATFCHRQPGRCFILDGPVLFCARCSGIYTGSFAFLLSAITAWRKPSIPLEPRVIAFVVVLVALTALEVLAEKYGFHGGNGLRFWLGTASGIGVLGLCCLDQNTGTEELNLEQQIGFLLVRRSLCFAFLMGGLIVPPVSFFGMQGSSITFNTISLLGFLGFVVVVFRAAIRTVLICCQDLHRQRQKGDGTECCEKRNCW